MCLNRIDWKKGDIPEELLKGKGYKCVLRSPEGIFTPHFTLDGKCYTGPFKDNLIQLGKEYESSKRVINSGDGGIYDSGFHIYYDIQDAMYEKKFWPGGEVYEVEFSDVSATGLNDRFDNGICIVAHKIKYIKQIKE